MENTNNAAQAVKIIRILGEEYQLIITNEKEEPRLREIGGFCDNTSKKCVVRDFVHEESTLLDKDNLAIEVQQNIRHEIVHAFLLESGLDANSGWADNEELVDWIALQGPKIYKVWQEAGAVEDNLKNG